MRKLLTAALLAGVTSLVTLVATAASPTIEPDAVLSHIKFLASDELKGRGDGSPELERAAEYIAQQFTAAGLEPGGDNGSFFQPFQLQAGLDVGAGNDLEIDSKDRAIHLQIGASYYPLAATPTAAPGSPSIDLDNVPLVFAGYGISSRSAGYDDYDGLDVKDKAVLIFSHEPQENRADSRLNGARPLRETTLAAKAQAARSRGARVLLVVSDPSHKVDEADYRRFTIDPDPDDVGITVLRVSRAELQPLIQEWQLDSLAAAIDRDLVPRSRPLPGADVDYKEFLARNTRTVRNVVGILPGSDPARRDEAIVIGAHYDHVGLGGRYSMAPELTGQIHNGADDNASGTASIIEIAKAAAAQRDRFPRTLVFIAFAGEERGLLGSAFYADHATVSLGNTITMLNLDMVGRSNGKVETSGLETAPSLRDDFQTAVKAVGIRVGNNGPGSGRSDDSSFLQRHIPSIIFFTGFHSDYHRPTDDWQKIDAPGTARVATLALEFAARIAARPSRPAFVN